MNVEWRGVSVSKIAGNPAQLDALRLHIEEVISGGVFRGSPRGQQFLRYVIEKSIEGDFDSLKERMIGIQLFGRAPSYDTGEDAIVRVTASDVRRRLQQHYGRYGEVNFRIDLQPGSYIPEITYLPGDAPAIPIMLGVVPVMETASMPEPASILMESRAEVATLTARPRVFTFPKMLLWVSTLLAVVAISYALWLRTQILRSPANQVTSSSLPWSALFERGRTLQIVPSDPDFASLQDLTGHSISLADYVSQNYLPDSLPLSSEMRIFCLKYLRGARAADVDLPIVADIASLANTRANKFAIRAARTIRPEDFSTDDDFVLLGSPIANPWVELFRDQLDFRFHFSGGSSAEWIENEHPAPNEMKTYLPVAGTFETKPPTWATYAIVAFVQNPHRRGHVLILAGVGSEGTAAAGKFAMNQEALTNALHKCGRPATGKVYNFELLLRVNVLNGSPLSTDVIACHTIA